MGNIAFAWDPRKARTNPAKHGISFEEAQSVFLDESARLLADPDHSVDERRFLLLASIGKRAALSSVIAIRNSMPRFD